MSSDDVVISVRNLTKTYRMFNHPGDRLKQAMTLGLRRYHRDFTALKDVTFEVRKGETIGIVGRNGSGKSTLLQLICGILKPTSGSVDAKGKISALLELGAGFNPEFTGRENVYFQGALMGMRRKEMDRRFDEIAEFSDIGEFIDQPVRAYSSGMFVRLAFSIMIHADTDILVVDEALAVGDEAFQKKCFEKLAQYIDGSEKILFFVSHNKRQIERVCKRTIWLEAGSIMQDGVSAAVCDLYQKSIHESERQKYERPELQPNVADSGEMDVLEVALLRDGESIETGEIEFHSALRVAVEFYSRVSLKKPEIIIGFHTTDSVYISAATSSSMSGKRSFEVGMHRIECRVPDVSLLPGVYQVRLGVFDQHRRSVWVGERLCTFNVTAPIGTNLTRIPDGLVDMPFEWTVYGNNDA